MKAKKIITNKEDIEGATRLLLALQVLASGHPERYKPHQNNIRGSG